MECKKDANLDRCNCTYEPCSRKGVCCDCIAYHLRSRELPACAFPADAEPGAQRMAVETLQRMAEGGVHDHLGGNNASIYKYLDREVVTRLLDEPDPAARDLARVHGYLGVLALSPDLMSLVRSEALQEDGDMRKVVERSYKDMCRATLEDLTRLRSQGEASLPASDELVAFSLLGGVENVVMRASWDDRYSTKDVLWTTLCVFLAVEAMYTGRLDLTADLAKYAGIIDRLAASSPPLPPDARS